jgi:hypothetical protein
MLNDGNLQKGYLNYQSPLGNKVRNMISTKTNFPLHEPFFFIKTALPRKIILHLEMLSDNMLIILYEFKTSASRICALNTCKHIPIKYCFGHEIKD